jgi:hypothetical protein
MLDPSTAALVQKALAAMVAPVIQTIPAELSRYPTGPLQYWYAYTPIVIRLARSKISIDGILSSLAAKNHSDAICRMFQ